MFTIINIISTVSAIIMLFSQTYSKYKFLFFDIDFDSERGIQEASQVKNKLQNPLRKFLVFVQIFWFLTLLSKFDIKVYGYHYKAGVGRLA